MLTKLKENKKELIILAVLLVISGVAHGYNMFQFPYFENDEGTYMSQAWSLLTQGELAPYTYWYDHAPGGWILIALWAKLTGGFFTFGASVNSGRVLMLLLHLGTTTLLFYTTKKLSGSLLAAIIAVLIFSLSPLGIYFQRRVLLDNIMIFWMFLSLALLLKDRLKLSHIIASGAVFGIAVLTKESAMFLIPAFIYVIYSRAHLHHRSFAIVKWLAVSGVIISFYFLYALQRGEFFPVGFFGGDSPHVSLFSTLQEQFGRGAGLPFWNQNSDFYINLREWVSRDPFTIIAGGIATLFSLVLSIRERSLRIPASLSMIFWVFLMRGGLVIDFYIVPLIPLLSLNTGMLVNLIVNKISFNKRLVYYPLVASTIVLVAFFTVDTSFVQYTKDETTPQVEAINWIKENVPENTYIVIDNYAYIDLHEARFTGDKIFVNADWFWKLSSDPQVRDNKYETDWQKIEYLALSHEMLKIIGLEPQNLLRKAFDNSYSVVSWKDKSTSYIDLKNYISTNGDWISIYKVQDKNKIALNGSWKFYKENFIRSYGQVIDLSDDDTTTSEGQSYAMLRAVWQDDKNTFNGVWAWTKDHLQHRTQDKLFSWSWVKDGEGYKLGDSAPATDADQDIALALLFASKKWGDASYLSAAKEIIDDIWAEEVIKVRGRYYLMAWADAELDEGYLINPSYLSPATYKIFSEVDTKHPWAKLVDDSYFLLNKLGAQKDNKTFLPPNWVLLDKKTGEIKSAAGILGEGADFYGFDAFRVMWRVALDAVWFQEPRATKYLGKVEPFFVEQWEKDRKFVALYDLNGNNRVSFSSLSTSAGAVSVFTIKNAELAQEVYSQLFESKYQYDGGYWDDQNNYYDQNWVWFGTALYSNNLSNLWED